MPFQNKINYQPAPAVEGDFCTANPYASYPAGEMQLIAGEDGVLVGKFAWINADTGEVSNKGSGPPQGFIHREGQAYIIDWLTEASMKIPPGSEVTVQVSGDYYVRVTEAVKPGDPVMALATDGTAGTSGEKTDFVFLSTAAAGELAKMSSWVKSPAKSGGSTPEPPPPPKEENVG